MRKLREDTQRKLIATIAWGSWLSALALTGVITYLAIVRPVTDPTLFQRVGGLFIIMLIGTGIAAGLALSRMKLGDTIARAFAEGYRAGQGKGPTQ